MHKKAIFLLSVICLLTFGHALFNGFVGDDRSFLVENDFYRDWSNVRYLFSREYITDADDVFNRAPRALVTGSVAYRPVLSLTYFVDYALWGLNPMGYHLHNVVLHLVNSFWVYGCIFLLSSSVFGKGRALSCRIAMLSAVIFCVHPLKVEPVCSIGYRADLLACFFVLTSFLLVLRMDVRSGRASRRHGFLAQGCFFLGLLAKESVVVYPFILVGYNVITRSGGPSFFALIKQGLSKYKAYFFLLGVYLCLYVFVMPNTSMERIALLGGTWIRHGLNMLLIFYEYVVCFVFPWHVKIFPPTSYPGLFMGGDNRIIPAICAVLFLGIISLLRLKKRDLPAFFIVWFWLSLIPILNVIPLPNPFAYRFMYFPSVAFAGILGIMFVWIKTFFQRRSRHKALGKIISLGYLCVCIGVTYISVFAWKSDWTLAKHMAGDFPQSPMAHLLMGLQYHRSGKTDLAREAALRSIRMGIRDPRAYHVAGMGLFHHPERALKYFEECVRLYPRYAACYTGAGKVYLWQGRYAKAAEYLKTSRSLADSFTADLYLLQSYLLQGRSAQADALIREIQQRFPHTVYQKQIARVLRLHAQGQLPVIF
jgi:hypothetical protein